MGSPSTCSGSCADMPIISTRASTLSRVFGADVEAAVVGGRHFGYAAAHELDVVVELRVVVELFVSVVEHAQVHVVVGDLAVGVALSDFGGHLDAHHAAHLAAVAYVALEVARAHAVHYGKARIAVSGQRALAFLPLAFDVLRGQHAGVDAVAEFLLEACVEHAVARGQQHGARAVGGAVGAADAERAVGQGADGACGAACADADVGVRLRQDAFGQLTPADAEREAYAPLAHVSAGAVVLFEHQDLAAACRQLGGCGQAGYACAYYNGVVMVAVHCAVFVGFLLFFFFLVCRAQASRTSGFCGQPMYWPRSPTYFCEASYSIPILSIRLSTCT